MQSNINIIIQDQKEEDKNFSKLIEKIGSIKIDKNNVIQTLHSVMETVEVLDKTLKGIDKKQLAIKGLKWLVDSQKELPIEEKLILNTIVDQVAPPAIDLIIDVSKGVSNLVKSKCPCF